MSACPTPCDDDCTHDCHEDHQVIWKKAHTRHECPAYALGTVTYTLIVPGRLTTVNATRRHHWSLDAAQTRLWRSDGFHVAKGAKIPRLGRVTITATPQQARGRLADAGAHSGCVKADVDSLVDAGVIEEDGPDVVVSLNQCAPVRVDARDEGLRIEIEPLDEETP